MKKTKTVSLLICSVILLVLSSSYTYTRKTKSTKAPKTQTINLFVTHGHCSTPFGGMVKNLNLNIPKTTTKNPLEDLALSFSIDPATFEVCSRDKNLTQQIQTPGLFSNKDNQLLHFTSKSIYTMGVDWYQINGILTIKGIKKEVKFFATGIRNPEDIQSSQLIINGQFDLLDWGIDYEKIVNGTSSAHPTKWMHLNMKIDIS